MLWYEEAQRYLWLSVASSVQYPRRVVKIVLPMLREDGSFGPFLAEVEAAQLR